MSENGREFSVSLDGTVKVVSVFVTVLMLGMSCLFAGIALKGDAGGQSSPLLFASIALLPILILTGLALFAPRRYGLDSQAIRVRRAGPEVAIPLDRVASVERIDRKALGVVWRTGGIGGFLGFVGYFHGSKVGTFRAYTTRSNQLVLIRLTKGAPVLLSPDEPEAFVAAVARHAHGSKITD